MQKPSAQIAISILEKLQKVTNPEDLAYFVLPNTVLTLSGARAFCDGVFYHEDQAKLGKWKEDIEESIKGLAKILEIFNSKTTIMKNPMGNNYVGYDIITVPGLKFSFQQTKLIDEAKYFLLEQNLNGEQLINKICELLKKNEKFQKYKKEDLKHIAFGILVGYPDTAIIESFPEKPENNPSTNAKIKYADYYWCPQPVYDYPKYLENDPSIKKHERLWSKILTDFYESDFHKNLAQDNNFQKKIEELQK